jgi:hypothetical protein
MVKDLFRTVLAEGLFEMEAADTDCWDMATFSLVNKKENSKLFCDICSPFYLLFILWILNNFGRKKRVPVT